MERCVASCRQPFLSVSLPLLGGLSVCLPVCLSVCLFWVVYFVLCVSTSVVTVSSESACQSAVSLTCSPCSASHISLAHPSELILVTVASHVLTVLATVLTVLSTVLTTVFSTVLTVLATVLTVFSTVLTVLTVFSTGASHLFRCRNRI